MGIIQNVLKLPNRETKAVLKVLRNLAAKRTPVRLEIENTTIQFFTILDLRREMVVISRPVGLRTAIRTGTTVRFTIPDHSGKTIRLTVKLPYFQLLHGGAVFLCEIPQCFGEPSHRASNRYNTSRFKNLFLMLPAQGKILRIIDLSEHGCKVFHGGSDEPDWVELGEGIESARIEIGNSVKLDLLYIVPRSVTPKMIGFEFRVSNSDAGRMKFSKLMDALENAEQNRLQIHSA